MNNVSISVSISGLYQFARIIDQPVHDGRMKTEDNKLRMLKLFVQAE
jgi:hypothetical protein